MKKSTRKVINCLRRYVGHEVLRTSPVCGDWSYTDSPILLVGFTSDGCIRCRYTGIDEDEEFVLPFQFTDFNWITYKKALKAKGNELNKWRGKKIRRIRPTSFGDSSFMDGDALTLISASKHHMVIMYNGGFMEGIKFVLRSDYMNPEEWELVE